MKHLDPNKREYLLNTLSDTFTEIRKAERGSRWIQVIAVQVEL